MPLGNPEFVGWIVMTVGEINKVNRLHAAPRSVRNGITGSGSRFLAIGKLLPGQELLDPSIPVAEMWINHAGRLLA
jgi:hypothetical protein